MPRRRNPDTNTFSGHHTKGYEGKRHAPDTPTVGQAERGVRVPNVKPSTSSSSPSNRASEPRHEHRPPSRAKGGAVKGEPVTAVLPRSRHPRAPASASHPVRKAGRGSIGGKPRRNVDVGKLADTANQAAVRRSLQAEGKPSTTGHAVTGALGGAATGAGVGTAVGGPVGAGVGAAAGAVGGGVLGARKGSKLKKQYKAATAKNPGVRKALLVEFLICMIVVALSPMTDKHKGESFTAWIKRTTAVMALFLFFGLLSAAGRGAAKVAVALGALVSVVLVMEQQDLIVKITSMFAPADENQLKPDSQSTFTQATTQSADTTGIANAGNAGAAGANVIQGLIK